jgi:hypothetical protein
MQRGRRFNRKDREVSAIAEKTTTRPQSCIIQGQMIDDVYLILSHAGFRRHLPHDATTGLLQPPRPDPTLTRAVYGAIVSASEALPAVPLSDNVSSELKRIRALTALSVADIAQLCGIKRRHIYNLLDGEPTGPHRAARIREILNHIEKWAGKFREPATLRSLLLSPLDHKGCTFISLVSIEDNPGAVQSAAYQVDRYIERLQGRKPVTRVAHSMNDGTVRAGQIIHELYDREEPPPEAVRP